jgi:hypothetical protein
MASYITSTQETLVLPANTYYGCPDTNGVIPKSAYPELTSVIGPVATTAFYEPISLSKSRFDPSKGRKFHDLSKDGAILMSPLSIVNEKTENFLLRTQKNEALWRWEGISSSNGKGCNVLQFVRALDIGSYERTYDIVRLRNLYPSIQTYTVNDLDLSKTKDLVDSTQTAVIADALSGYDILTELAESRETLHFLKGKVGGFADMISKLAHEDEHAWRRGRRMTPKSLLRSGDKALRRLGGRWMEIRYAIMPLFYSLRDIKGLVDDNGARYKTSRKRDKVESHSTGVTLPTSGYYLERHVSGSVSVASTSKARYDIDGLSSLYARRIASNPFATAWELVPLSFVVDWFFNIGDVITAATSIDFSNQRCNCTAVRTSYEEELYFVQFGEDTTLEGRTWNGITIDPLVFQATPPQRTLIQKRTVNNYSRSLFTRAPGRVQFEPFLNWKRMIDGAVLAYQPTKNLLRSLK